MTADSSSLGHQAPPTDQFNLASAPENANTGNMYGNNAAAFGTPYSGMSVDGLGFDQAMDMTLGLGDAAGADPGLGGMFLGDGLFNFGMDGSSNLFTTWNWG